MRKEVPVTARLLLLLLLLLLGQPLDKPFNRFSPSVLLSVYLSMYLYLYLCLDLSLSLHRNSSPGIGRNLEEEPQPPRGFHLVLDPNYYYYYIVHRYGNFRVKPGGILERF